MSSAIDLGNGVSWLRHCYPEADAHVHVSAFLLDAPGGHVLVDSGSFVHRDSLLATIDELSDGTGPGAMILTHSDYPHSGNIPAFRDAWGDFEVVASVGDAEIQGLSNVRRTRFGKTESVLGRSFTFLDPPLADRSHTSWIYDEDGRTLFVADGFGSLHADGQCDSLWGDLPVEGRDAAVREFHEQTLSWLVYVDRRRLMSSLWRIFERHQVDWIAPIHGPPIACDHITSYMEALDEGVRRILEDNTATLGSSGPTTA